MGFSLQDIPGLSSGSKEEEKPDPQPEVEEQPSESLGLNDRLRLGAQGLLFNFSDEAFALVKSLAGIFPKSTGSAPE